MFTDHTFLLPMVKRLTSAQTGIKSDADYTCIPKKKLLIIR